VLWTCSYKPCQSDYTSKPVCCVYCGHDQFHLTPVSKKGQIYGSDDFRPKERVLPKIQSIVDLEQQTALPRYDWGDFPQLKLPTTSRVTVEGLPGSLKSTFSRRCALSLASQGIPVLLASTEEGLQSSTFQLGLKRAKSLIGLNAFPPLLHVVYVKYMEDLVQYLREWGRNFGVVIVDSITLLNPNKEFIENLLETCKLGFIFVEHLTTGKIPVGGFRLSYLSDVRIVTFKKEERYLARIEKNRFGSLAEFSIEQSYKPKEPSKIIDFPSQNTEDV
jgi:hypothetical protein